MTERRVVITGLGALTPVGANVSETWQSFCAGRGGGGMITRFDATEYSTQVACEIKDFDAEVSLGKRHARRADPFVQYALVAANEAVAHSGLDINDAIRDRVAVVFGSGIGGLKTWEDNWTALYEKGPRRVSPMIIPMLIGNMAAGMISIEFETKGPNKAITTACATSGNCIGDAYRMIQWGECDYAIAGGSEAPIQPISIAGFAKMGALTSRNDAPLAASRPFDQERDGFMMGEGAGAVVLETLESAVARGAEILCELVGYGQNSDGHHIAAPLPCGSGAAAAMLLAMKDAGVTPQDVGYINAHAPSTQAGDLAEVHALKLVYGDGASIPLVSSTKSMTGHLLGAAGAVELIACIQAMADGVVPPTINHQVPDPDCDFDCVPNVAREARVDVAMSNSFGFGGHNCCLIVKRFA